MRSHTHTHKYARIVFFVFYFASAPNVMQPNEEWWIIRKWQNYANQWNIIQRGERDKTTIDRLWWIWEFVHACRERKLVLFFLFWICYISVLIFISLSFFGNPRTNPARERIIHRFRQWIFDLFCDNKTCLNNVWVSFPRSISHIHTTHKRLHNFCEMIKGL